MRIPRVVHLPFGWSIPVKQLSQKALNEYAEDHVDGLWEVDTRTIYVSKDLPITQKVDTLLHELDHALNDLRHSALQRAGIFQRAQKARKKAKRG